MKRKISRRAHGALAAVAVLALGFSTIGQVGATQFQDQGYTQVTVPAGRLIRLRLEDGLSSIRALNSACDWIVT